MRGIRKLYCKPYTSLALCKLLMPGDQQLSNELNTDHLDADLKGRSVRGGVITLTSQGTQFALQTVSTVVLARLLTPTDFGLVAMVTAITGLASAFADFGLSEATIQRKEINHDQVSALFWINLAIGLGLTLIVATLGPILAWIYHEPRIRTITFVLSLTFLVGGLRVQPNALLKRQMRFGALAFRDIASYAIAVPLAIVMAWRGSGYWALVALPLTLNTVQMVLSWLLVHWRPSLPRRASDLRSLLAFGGNVSVSYLVTNLNRSADGALVGWYWGAGPLGFYSRAYNLLMLPVRQLSLPAGNVAIPTFSRIQNEAERFARYYLRTASLIMWICAPLFGFLSVAAAPVIALILGPQWGEAAPVFQILAVSALGQLFLEMSIWMLVSRGLSGRLLKMLLIISPILIGGFLVGLPFGIKGVALAGSVVQIAILPWMLHFTFRGTELSLTRLVQAIVYPLSLCLAAILFAELSLFLIGPDHVLSQLLTIAFAFVSTYGLAVLIPRVRAEVLSFKDLLGALGLSRQTV